MTRSLLLLTACVVFAIHTSAISDEVEVPLVANVIDGDSSRTPQHTVAPTYPRKARRDRIEGEVQVCFDIDRRGKPRRLTVRRSTHQWFERPSIKAVRASRFKALSEDEPLQIPKTCRTFIFSLVSVQD